MIEDVKRAHLEEHSNFRVKRWLPDNGRHETKKVEPIWIKDLADYEIQHRPFIISVAIPEPTPTKENGTMIERNEAYWEVGGTFKYYHKTVKLLRVLESIGGFKRDMSKEDIELEDWCYMDLLIQEV